MSEQEVKSFALNAKQDAIQQGSAPLFAGGVEEGAMLGAVWAMRKMKADIQQCGELIVKWMKAYEAEKNDNAVLTTENAQLRAALQNLIDEQNGPPLETRRAQWEQAMNEAKAILSK